ncbi:MAG: efflux RND transporter periplasmic adaptor subunit [Aquabacterium sp.]|nr:efflux RND transporter periplasmic adaptor subunit [Aquabacterium sp.]
MTVTTVAAQRIDWPQRLAAAGNIAAWQEVVIGSELGGLRLVEVVAQVGDRVRRGQLLARLSVDMIDAELAQTRAGLAEAQALLAEAQANANRARELQPSGMISSQQAQQAITAEQAARARLASLQARLQADELRLRQTRIVAPDDGVISARVATEGAMAQPGQELFRLIRRGRLEWRAEVAAADLARLEPGTPAAVRTPSGVTLEGTVRQVAPTVDTQTRNGLVYVDLARPGDAKPGMFVRGEFSFGRSPALTLPQTAVLLRDGHAVVLRVGADQRVQMAKVQTGRRQGDRVEVLDGLPGDARVIASGGAFLADGDLVKVVSQ